MLTPQDIDEKEFSKAVFGGYDMAGVDDFLEELQADYTTIYNENASLKAKLKVLVEKVEEYRSTEDAMRMALLTAQQMSDEMTENTKRKCDDMLRKASNVLEESRASIKDELVDENAKLESAKARTVSFVNASRQIIDQYSLFLDRLGEVTRNYGGVQTAAPAAEAEPPRSPEPEPARPVADALPVTQPPREPAREQPAAEQQPVREQPVYEQQTMEEPPAREPQPVPDDTETEIENVVADVLSEQDMSAETKRFDVESIRRAQEEAARSQGWDEEDELTTPRPKFDFTNLQFGTNYQDNRK